MSLHDQRENYGRGEVDLEVSSLDFLDIDVVVRRLRATFESPKYVPQRLPGVALRLLELTKNPDVPFREVGALLEEDQLLTAEVLRIAQSAHYSPPNAAPVRSLEEAVSRLGLRRVGELFLQAGMNMRVFRVKAYQTHMDVLRRHSAFVAQLARLVGRQTALFDEHAFLCGLLHDVGIAASLIAFAEATPRGTEPPLFAQVWPAIRDSHEHAGGLLAKLWGLPTEVAFVVEHHHHFVVGGYPHPTSAVIEVANTLAEEVGLGFGQESTPDGLLQATRALRLSGDDMGRLRERAKVLAESAG